MNTHREHQEAFARSRLERILNGGAKGVIQGLRAQATRQKLRGKAAEEITTVCGYLENNLERMRYDEYLRNGYPIASGVIEGACRHLIKDRMERSGMRWALEGAQAMLHLRCVHAADQWENFQQHRIAAETKRLYAHADKVMATYSLPTLQV